MSFRLFASIPLLAAVLPALGAQTTILRLDPRASYLRASNDVPAAPMTVALSALSAGPGTWLRIGTVGGFVHIGGGVDDRYSLIGVFSAGSQILPATAAHRVPGALAAGPSFPSGVTHFGALPTDIPEDFAASRHTWGRSVLVRVPAGATHVVLGTHDSYYQDNLDPNGDFAAVIELLPAPPLAGTGEHLELRAGVGGAPAALPSEHGAAAGAVLAAELHHPIGMIENSIYALLADVVLTGGPVPSLLPWLWFGGSAVVLRSGAVGAGASWSVGWSATVPSNVAGLSLVLQGVALAPVARNGWFESTIAHRVALQ
jgi:hypothetical protein